MLFVLQLYEFMFYKHGLYLKSKIYFLNEVIDLAVINFLDSILNLVTLNQNVVKIFQRINR